MNYFIFTFGCQQNIADSQQIAQFLQKRGHRPASSEARADLIVVNACSVRKSATDRAYAKIKQSRKARQKVILAGCLTEHDKNNLAGLVDEIWQPNDYFCAYPLADFNFRAYIPVMTGCNNFCAYCVVPFTRGREISRSPKKIIGDVKKALKNGAQEIVLLGQNVNSYKSQISKLKTQNHNLKLKTQKKYLNFADLLKIINDLSGNFWLTFISNHPKDVSDELIKTVAKCRKISPLFHLPFQAGSNAVLKKMNRHYTAGQYQKLIKKIRLAFKKYRSDDLPLALTTDVIVGFPGETKKQFQESAKLMREVGFDMAFIVKYSPRPGTAAGQLKDDVSFAEKKRREKILTAILRKTALKNNQKYLRQTVAVLVEAVKPGLAFGKTKTGKNVKVAGQAKIGEVVNVNITKIGPWGISGKLKTQSANVKTTKFKNKPRLAKNLSKNHAEPSVGKISDGSPSGRTLWS